MKLAEQIFRKHFLIEENLLPYGFEKTGNVYTYSKTIHNGDFELIVSITDGKLSAKLIDKDFDDEYTRIDVEENAGSFIAQLKEECKEVLQSIREKCFKKEYFIGTQANSVTDYAIKKYESFPEFLWKDSPDFGVFRNGKNNKWFGIIMNIKKEKIIKNSVGFIEVINLKLDEKTEEILNKNGVYPAYHMNKKYWVSVVLNSTLLNEEIFKLIDISFENSLKK